MKRFSLLVLSLILLSNAVFAKTLNWELCKKNAEQFIREGQFEQAIQYLTPFSQRNDLDGVSRIIVTSFLISHILNDGEKGQALDVIIPVYADMVKKYGEKSFEAFETRDLLIFTYSQLKQFDKALKLANVHVKLAFTKEYLARAYLDLADVYRERQEYTLALRSYIRAEKLLKTLNVSGKYNTKLSRLYNNRAATYSKMANYKKALVNYQAALNRLAKKNRSYYKTLFNISNVYEMLGEPEKAKNYLIEVANYYLKAQGVDSQEYFTIENEIGVLDQNYGRYDEALMRYKKVLRYAKRLGSEDMQQLALKNIGSTYQDLGDDKLARSYLEKALVINLKLPQSIELADNYEGLALLASTLQEELNYYDKSLRVREALHQNNDAKYANVLTNKAMAYQKHQHFQEAEDTYRKAFAILEKVEPKGHKMGFYLISRASLWFEQKKYEKAECMLLEAIEMLKQTVGENHPDVAYAYNNLGMVYSAVHQKKKAIAYFRLAEAVSKATEGANHASTKRYHNNLFWTLLDRGR